jgi:hypothetical protein
VQRGLEAVDKAEADTLVERKSVVWKIWIASELKRRTSALSTWIANRLNMGAPQLLGRYVSGVYQAVEESPSEDYDRFI